MDLPFLTAKVHKGYYISICHWQGLGTKGEFWELSIIFCRSEWGVFSKGSVERDDPSACWFLSPQGTLSLFPILPTRIPHSCGKRLRSFSTKLLSRQAAAGTGAWSYSSPGAKLCISFFWNSWCSHQPVCPIPQVPLNISLVLQHISFCPQNLSDPVVQILKGHSFDFWDISPVTSCQLGFLMLILPFDPNGKANFWLNSTQLPIYWVLV